MNSRILLVLAPVMLFVSPSLANITIVGEFPNMTILENLPNMNNGATILASPDSGVANYVKGQSFVLNQTEEIHNLYIRMDDVTASTDDMGNMTLEFFETTGDPEVPDGQPGTSTLFSQTEPFPAGAGLGNVLRYALANPLSLNAGSYAFVLSTDDMNITLDVDNEGMTFSDGALVRSNGTVWQNRSAIDFVFGLTGPAADPLKLVVDRGTGGVAMENANTAGLDYDLDYYEIKSPAGSLNANGWMSFEDQDMDGFPTGNGSGNGWEEGGNNNAHQLIESYLLDSSTFTSGNSISMGDAFVPGATEDLAFSYHEPGAGGPTVGIVEYVGVATPACDIDGSGFCDKTDLRMLYDDIAAGTAGGPSDIDGSGLVDNDDIDSWLTSAGTLNGKEYLPGDDDLDGNVGGPDFTNLAFHFGGEGLPNAYWDQGNYDGVDDDSVFRVGGADFTSLAFNFGHMSVSSVPEPNAIGSLAAGMLGLMILSRWSRRPSFDDRTVV